MYDYFMRTYSDRGCSPVYHDPGRCDCRIWLVSENISRAGHNGSNVLVCDPLGRSAAIWQKDMKPNSI